MALAAIAFTRNGVGYRPVKRPRPGPRGVIKPGQLGHSYNDFPKIIANFPRALTGIVEGTTHALADLAASLAPVQQNPRPGDPVPGTLKASKTVRFLHPASTAPVPTGRVEFTAKDPRGHRYAKPLETGSIRKSKRGLVKVAARPFLVDAIRVERTAFLGELDNLEALITAGVREA